MISSGYLFDSNIAIAIIDSEPTALDFLEQMRRHTSKHFYSVVTECEVLTGVRPEDVDIANHMFLPHHTLPVTSRIARRAATIRREQKRHGRKLKTPDALIIATALEHRLSLVSRDSDMFFVSVEYGLSHLVI